MEKPIYTILKTNIKSKIFLRLSFYLRLKIMNSPMRVLAKIKFYSTGSDFVQLYYKQPVLAHTSRDIWLFIV